MAAFDFDTIKSLLQKSIKNGREAELTLYISNREYMIIIYDDCCSFKGAVIKTEVENIAMHP